MTEQTDIEEGPYWMRWGASKLCAFGLNGWELCWVEPGFYGNKRDKAVYTAMSDNPYQLSCLISDGLEYRRIEAPND